MKTSLKMYAVNIALQNILGAFEYNDKLEDVYDDIQVCDNNAFRNMEFWVERNPTQYEMAYIEMSIYHSLMTDICFYLELKEDNPSLSQSDINSISTDILEYIYKM